MCGRDVLSKLIAQKKQRREAMGHASLMRPTKPLPGVSFAFFGRYAMVRTGSAAVRGSLFCGGVIEPPLGTLVSPCEMERYSAGH